MWASFDRRCTTWPSATTETKMVARVEEIVATDARYTARLMGSMVGISLGAARTILKRNLKMRKIFERWIPHLLTDEQKKACTQGAKMLLKQFPNYNAQSLANVINNEIWVNFSEPKRKIQNKIWATKSGKRLFIAKQTMGVKKIWYAIFFTTQGPAIQVIIP